MARPPRIPNLLPDEILTIYFVTFCTHQRKEVLATPSLFEKFKSAATSLKEWRILSAVIMPDHIHLLLTPFHRDANIKNAVAALKRSIRKGNASWAWQEGCFDRLLRSEESAQEKWQYMRDNPIRAGLVKHWKDWPYRMDLPDNLSL